MGGVLGHHGLPGREHSPLEQVTAARGPIREAEHHVHVCDRTILAHGDIADERQQLALLVTGIRRG
jgi:hypothetical protein